MPLVYQKNINPTTKVGVWHITEAEDFFSQIPLQREITHPHKRLQHLAGRFLLKELFPDFPIELIRIASTKKPFLENDVYHFSISHCGDYAAVIVSNNHRVGADIEMPSKKIEKVKHKFSSGAMSIIQMGEEQIGHPSTAVNELVKNAYDADADKCYVYTQYDKDPTRNFLIIKDNGLGMNAETLFGNWLITSRSSKRNEDHDLSSTV